MNGIIGLLEMMKLDRRIPPSHHMIEYDVLLWVACKRSTEVCGNAHAMKTVFIAEQLCILDAEVHR